MSTSSEMIKDAELDFGYMTPEELLEHYCQGSEQAFTALVELIGGRVFAFICRYITEYHTAEDVYQNVWTKVAINAKQYDGRARLSTWIYQIARNCSIDAIRINARKKEVAVANSSEDDSTKAPLTPEMVFSKDLPPDEQLTVEELGKRIINAVATLPSEQREVFLLKEDADLTFEEIAQILGISKDTAKSRMRYGLNRLRAALGKEARLYGLLEGL